MIAKETSLALRIGTRRLLVEVADLAEASRIYCELRDRSGLGVSRMPSGRVYDTQTTKLVATLSYNGKVWAADDCCLFNPYEPAEASQ